MAAQGAITKSLQRQFREYYSEGTGGDKLTFQQRRLLDAVRNNPRSGQLNALAPYLIGAGGNSKIGKDALYNAGVALGATAVEVGGTWQRLTQVEDYDYFRNLENRDTEDYDANKEYENTRRPGGTQNRSEDLEVFGRKLPRTDEMAAVLPLMGDKYKEWYRTGSVQGWQVADIQRLDRAFADPFNPNWGEVASFSKYGDTGDFLRQVRLDTEDIVRSQEQFAEGAEEIARREEQIANTPVPYHDPSRPFRQDVVLLTPGEAEQRGLIPATDEQMDAAGVYGPEVPEYSSGADDIEPGESSRPVGDGSRPTPERAYEGIAQPGLQTPPSSGDDDTGGTGTGTGGTGTGGGYGGSSDLSDVPADENIPQDWRDSAMEMYPQYYAIVRNIPEIAQLLQDAIEDGYSENKFQAELEQTNWYQQTSGASREWDINSQRDPASAQASIDERITYVRDMALREFGVRLSSGRLAEIAEDSLRFGWSERFLQNAIGDVATTSTVGISQLREGYIGQKLRKTANDYGIAVSDATFNQWVNKVAVGEESTDSWQDYAKLQAKNLFPSVADRIDAGENFQQIVDPYRESAARLLEIDGGNIDFTQPDFIKAVTYQDDKGEQRPMSFTEWNDYVRQNKSFGYEYTDQAQQRAYQVANSLANMFGKV